MYYIRCSGLCAAIVKLYCTYYLYYLVLRVISDLCAVYLYYFAAMTQIIRALAALTQLVPSNASHLPPPLKSQWWRSCSGTNRGAPIPARSNVGPFIPLLSYQRPNQSICTIQIVSNQPAHKSQFLIANPRPIQIRSRRYDPTDTIHPI